MPAENEEISPPHAALTCLGQTWLSGLAPLKGPTRKYEHPDDKNWAYFPKFIVVLSLHHRHLNIDASCRCRQPAGLPPLHLYRLLQLHAPDKDVVAPRVHYGIALVFFFISFAMFYYEGCDQDMCFPPCLTYISSSSS
ncbi:LIMR family protein [Platanthera guangdongensis]|uniref:LIMR family protein n=1 Tax=Platanthera guangdongensis TaxID=2320717 RepID=A0ABR2M2P0_9ASPA